MKCEWPHEHECEVEPVAKIGLPNPNAMWVCKVAFNEWERIRAEEKEPEISP